MHKVLEPILSETMGVCVYQEQVIQILADVAGYTPGEADLVRRGISKKSKKTLDEHREIFAQGSAKKSGLTREEADAIWDALMGFARYGFNRAHAADYAVIVAQTGYLKAHYPVEYMAALLTVERHDTEKVGILIAECRRMGIEVLPPSVNVSEHMFTIEQLPAGRPAPATDHRVPLPGRAGRGHPHGPGRDQERGRRADRRRCSRRGARSRLRRWSTSATASTCARSTAAGWSA